MAVQAVTAEITAELVKTWIEATKEAENTTDDALRARFAPAEYPTFAEVAGRSDEDMALIVNHFAVMWPCIRVAIRAAELTDEMRATRKP